MESEGRVLAPRVWCEAILGEIGYQNALRRSNIGNGLGNIIGSSSVTRQPLCVTEALIAEAPLPEVVHHFALGDVAIGVPFATAGAGVDMVLTSGCGTVRGFSSDER